MLFKFNIVLVVLMVLMLTGVVKFGDEVIVSKLENVDVGYGNENLDNFSKWNVLKDEEN